MTTERTHHVQLTNSVLGENDQRLEVYTARGFDGEIAVLRVHLDSGSPPVEFRKK